MGHTTFNDENGDPAIQAQFKGLNYMKSLRAVVDDNLKRSISCGKHMSGFELVNIVERFITSSDAKKCEGSPRDSAVRVCYMLLKEGFLRPVSGADSSFNEDRRTLYRLGNADEVQSVAIFPKELGSSSRDVSRERATPARKSSFSRILQSPMLRRASTSRNSSKTRSIITNASSSSSSTTGTARSPDDDELLDDEARLFEFALSKLLTLVDIPQIEELVDMQAHCGAELKDGSTVHLLTSILAKMGLWSEGEEEGADEETAYILAKHRRAKLLHAYFKSVVAMCPRLQITEDRSIEEYEQVEQWGRQALRAVSDRLDSITRNGYSPLVPKEFAKGVAAISLLRKEKLAEALVYLCGMIPFKLRRELMLILDFLHQCESTNLIFNLCDSRSCKLDPCTNLGENQTHAMDTLRTYILPLIGTDIEKQRYVISTLVACRLELAAKVAELREEALSRCSPVPARFCEAAQEDDATDRQLADLITLILKDERLSQQDKFKKMQLMQTQHPKAYAIFVRRS